MISKRGIYKSSIKEVITLATRVEVTIVNSLSTESTWHDCLRYIGVGIACVELDFARRKSDL